MGTYNPYDDYDPFDPTEDDSGSFEFVEDEYDSMEPYMRSVSANAPAQTSGSTQAFPKTMVRNAPIDPRGGYVQEPEPRGGVLHRKGRGRRVRSNPDPMPYADAGYVDQYYDNEPPRPQRRRRRRHHGCLVTLLIMVLAVVGVYWVVAHPIDEKLAFTPAEQETVGNSLSFSVPSMPYYVLALGSDAREGDTYSRTDTMVLARVDFWGGKLTLLSIPRDTKVEIAGYGTQKINAAYAFGGVGAAVSAVSNLTGVPINHVAVVHFEELVDLVDYLGGVTVNVPVAVSDSNTGLSIPAGVQTMDGATALNWARTRYGYERGDFQRQEDQRILITAIMNRMLSLSPREMPGALNRLGDLIGTDLRCYNLVPLFLRFKLASPTVYSTSVPSTTAMIDGVSYVIADEAALAEMMRTINAGGDPGSPVN